MCYNENIVSSYKVEMAELKKRGFQPKRSNVVQLAPSSMIAEVAKPVPLSQLVPLEKPFQGDKKTSSVLPLLPSAVPLLPSVIPSVIPSVMEPKKFRQRKPLRHAEPTSNYRPRRAQMEVGLPQLLEEQDPILMQYYEKQNEIQGNNPYATDTERYMPQTRRKFYRFIQDNYKEFELESQMKSDIDYEACAKLGADSGAAVEAFLYQKFIREYIRNASPYRGILVYHGLGSGKTCSAIAAAEALYGTSNKGIIVMTPASLRGNFMSEISFCGFRHFNVHNHWIAVPLDDLMYVYGHSVLSLKEAFLNRVSKRDPSRKFIWIPDFTQEENYGELEQQEREDIREQLTEMIDSRITFISYNGISAATLKEYACQQDADGNRFFDNKVIVVDEIHNLTRLMQGNILPYIMKRKGRARKIPPEPIVPGKWEPSLCGREENYKRAYLFYRLLSDARNSKIIGLSGTPLINFPEELGILSNLLAGYTECVEFILQSVDKEIEAQCKKIAEEELRIDIVRFKTLNQQQSVLLSVFNEGYERVPSDDEFQGVRYNEEAQDGIRVVYGRIKERLKAAGIPIGEETYVSHARLPIDDETFKQEFINPDLSIKNKMVLQKRLTGLISYYKGSKVEYMPEIIKNEVVECALSDYSLPLYIKERKGEIEGEIGKKKEAGDIFAIVEVFAKMKNPSSYRFRSRALCNFAFPTSIGRPFPNTEEVDEETAPIEEPITEQIGEDASQKEREELERQILLAEAEEEAADNAISEVGDEAEEEDDAEVAEEEDDTELLKEITIEQLQELVNANNAELMPKLRAEYQRRGVAFPMENLRGGGEDDDMVREMLRPESEEQLQQLWTETSDDAEMRGLIEEVMREKGFSIPLAPAAPLAPVIPLAPKKQKRVVIVEDNEENQAVDAIKEEFRKLTREELVSAWETSDDDMKPFLREIFQEKGIPLPKVVLAYKDRIVKAMRKLDEQRDRFLRLGRYPGEPNRLGQFSTKLDAILRRLQNSKGSNLIYSQFKTVEGMGVLGIALKANGYAEIKIDGTDLHPRFSEQTIESFFNFPQQKRFILFTGEGSRERRTLILNIFNGNFDKLPEEMSMVLQSQFSENRNTRGEICWVIGITGAGAEGISLKCCRSVHIMEPYWNNVRLDQVKGRAIRICSHKDLPVKDRNVEIYTYYTVFSDEQKKTLDMTLRTTDDSETSDQKVYNVGIKKDKVNQELLTMMQETAVDCELNEADNGGVTCLEIDGRPDQYLFDPDLQVDKLITSIEFKEEKRKPVSTVSKMAMPPPSSSKKVSVTVMQWRDTRYLLSPKEGEGGMVMNLYAFEDKKLLLPLGTIALNPVSQDLKGMKPIFK